MQEIEQYLDDKKVFFFVRKKTFVCEFEMHVLCSHIHHIKANVPIVVLLFLNEHDLLYQTQ